MNLEEIQKQVENRLEALGLNSTSFITDSGIEQLVINQNKQCIIVLNVRNVNKIAIDKKPTLVSENMYDKENNKYAVQEGFYLVDSTKGTQTVEQENTIVDAIINHLTGSSKPELKLLP